MFRDIKVFSSIPLGVAQCICYFLGFVIGFLTTAILLIGLPLIFIVIDIACLIGLITFLIIIVELKPKSKAKKATHFDKKTVDEPTYQGEKMTFKQGLSTALLSLGIYVAINCILILAFNINLGLISKYIMACLIVYTINDSGIFEEDPFFD